MSFTVLSKNSKAAKISFGIFYNIGYILPLLEVQILISDIRYIQCHSHLYMIALRAFPVIWSTHARGSKRKYFYDINLSFLFCAGFDHVWGCFSWSSRYDFFLKLYFSWSSRYDFFLKLSFQESNNCWVVLFVSKVCFFCFIHSLFIKERWEMVVYMMNCLLFMDLDLIVCFNCK